MNQNMSKEDALALEVVRLRNAMKQADTEYRDAKNFLVERQSEYADAQGAYHEAKEKFDKEMES